MPPLSQNLIIALVVLPLLGALIAWMGDVIGYRLGRTRRSLLGLRPRATARLVGVVVGALLPLAGLGFAMAVSQDARDAILRIRQLRQETIDLGRDRERLTAERSRALEEAREARDRARSADAERMSAEQRLAQTQGALDHSQALLQAAQSSLDTTRLTLEGVKGDLTSTRGDLSSARADLGKARKDLDHARESLSTAQADLTAARQGLSQAQSDLEQARTELEDARESLVLTEADLAGARKQMQSMQAELETLATLQRNITAAQDHLASLETDLARYQDRLAETRQTLDRYRLAARAIIEQEVAYEPGAEIIRAIVESALTLDQLEAILEELLNYSALAAARHGIAAGPTGRSVRVVSPVPPEMLLPRVREEDIVREVARQISGGDVPTYVVIVRAWGRAFKDQAEPMAAEFWAAPNRVVFTAGEAILSAEVDGSMPRAHVFRTLWQTVSEIRRVAANRGMLPSPKTGRYGEVSAEELLESLDRILSIGGPAVVRVVVVNDARVAQPEEAPMMVTLTVERAPPR